MSTLTILFFQLVLINYGAPASSSSKSDKVLYLTPYIERNDISQGRKLAEVKGLGWKEKSYSGLLTINKEYDTNMFFWYFPSQRKAAEVPLVLWLNGFSTASSYGVFLQNGPYSLNKGPVPKPRKISWQKYYHVVYIDNPVGVGFSHTKSIKGYSVNLNQTSNNLKSALLQFFQLFPELSKHEFYLAGLSLAGKYISALAYWLYNDNSFNLKGIFLGNPVLDPAIQFHFRDYLYEMGFIDNKQGVDLEKRQQTMLDFLEKKDYQQAYVSGIQFLIADKSYIVNATGLESVYDYEHTYVIEDYYNAYMEKPKVKKALHVGNLTFDLGDYAMTFFAEGFCKSVAPWLEKMVEKIKMLIYVGQLDVICAYPMVVDVLTSLNWSGKEGYENADRIQLREKGKPYVWGYFKNFKTLTDVMIRNAGHSAVTDQPEHIFNLLLNFTDYNRFQ